MAGAPSTCIILRRYPFLGDGGSIFSVQRWRRRWRSRRNTSLGAKDRLPLIRNLEQAVGWWRGGKAKVLLFFLTLLDANRYAGVKESYQGQVLSSSHPTTRYVKRVMDR